MAHFVHSILDLKGATECASVVSGVQAALKGFQTKLIQKCKSFIADIHPATKWTSDVHSTHNSLTHLNSTHLVSWGCEQPQFSGNWIWIQPSEHFNPRVESRFCAFAAPRNVHCLFIVVAKRLAWVTI